MSTSQDTTAPLRLTILVTGTQRRGAEVFGERLSTALPGFGWSVDFVALGRSPGDESSSVAAYALSPNPVGRLQPSVVRTLRERLSGFRPDVVLANGSSTLHYGAVAVRTLRNRPRLAYASIGDPSFWANSPRRRLNYRAFLAMVDRVFSVSGPTAAQLTAVFGVAEDRIRVLPTGVPDPFFVVERSPHHEGLHILFLGSLSAEKNPLAAIDILGRLPREMQATLRMVGTGPLRDEVQHAAIAAGVDQHLELVGSVADVRSHLAWADVLVLTSNTEGLPAATLEAAASGIPSVAFEVGGVAETIRDAETGRLIAVGDTIGAADALRSYERDPETRIAHGRAARRMAANSFTIDAAVRRYDRALRDLARGDE